MFQPNDNVKVINEKLERANQAGNILSLEKNKVVVVMDTDGEHVTFSHSDLELLGR